jgi:hypothetical protein
MRMLIWWKTANLVPVTAVLAAGLIWPAADTVSTGLDALQLSRDRRGRR